MAIQWFPGHMNKARNEIKEIMPQMDVIIEVLDARIPYSSENPMVTTLREGKPVIKILNKADLADPKMTQAWKDYFEQESGVKAIAFGHDKAAAAWELLFDRLNVAKNDDSKSILVIGAAGGVSSRRLTMRG